MNPAQAIKSFVVATLFAMTLPSFAADAPLKIKVFNGGEENFGFAINSVIVMGNKDAVLVDAQFTLSNAHRLIAEILETGKHLTTIYVTHAHPDHFFALEQLKAAFPQARIVSTPAVAQEIDDAFDFKLKYWGKVLGNNAAKTRVKVEPLADSYIDLEGKKLEVLGPMQGDIGNSSAVWIPTIKTLIAGDAVFSHTHVWVQSAKTPQERQNWLKTLDQFAALKPTTVVPGHSQNNRQLDPKSIQFTRNYIQTFERELATAKDSVALIKTMNARYPHIGLPICLEFSAKSLKDGWKWDGEWPQNP